MLNSNENFEANDSLQLNFTHIRMPKSGSGKRRWKFGTDNCEGLLRKKKSVIVIQNKDQLCCARALVTAKTKVDNSPEYDDIKRGRKIQETRCGLNEIKQFGTVLNDDYQIVVISAEHGHSIMYKGLEDEKQLMLLMHDGHFDVITSLAAFFSRSYFCLTCERGFNHDDLAHRRCRGKKCFACQQMDCPDFKRCRQKNT